MTPGRRAQLDQHKEWAADRLVEIHGEAAGDHAPADLQERVRRKVEDKKEQDKGSPSPRKRGGK